jgi:multisubunit Na+/H+ antiporter MnhE subunit
MRKAINTAALIMFIWLVIDAFQIHNLLIGILLAGVIPGTDHTLHPLVHLGLLAVLTIAVLFEIFSDNLRPSKYIRSRFNAKLSQA